MSENIKEEIKMGLRLLAFKSVSLEGAAMDVVEEAMQESDWQAVSAVTENGDDKSRYYYSTAM